MKGVNRFIKTKMDFKDETYSWKNTSLLEFVLAGNCPHSWKEFFSRENVLAEIQKVSDRISEVIKAGKTVYPPPELVFRAFHVPVNRVKVVLIGQDPYHDGNAVGLCFSVPRTAKSINPSLQNIYTELENEGFSPKRHGDLSEWANQGVMMLNTALTVEKGDPETHLDVWYDFFELVLQEISQKSPEAVWMFLGTKAMKFSKYAKPERSVWSSHPSPLSAYKQSAKFPAFIGSGVFGKVNEMLQEKIVWDK